MQPLLPSTAGSPSPLQPKAVDWDVLLTAETHNFPAAVAPYPGAETGAGGRIRDTHATGVGSIMLAATAGYCTGNLLLEGAPLPWEDPHFVYPENLAHPSQVVMLQTPNSNPKILIPNSLSEPLIQNFSPELNPLTLY